MSDVAPDAPRRQLINAVRQQRRATDSVSAELAAYYDLLKRSKRLKQVLVAVCKCQRRCTLLHVYQTPRGLAFHQPRHRLSPGLNDRTSNTAGRAKNTEDGDHKWRRTDGMMSQAVNLNLNCDHVAEHLLEFDSLEMGTPGRAAETII